MAGILETLSIVGVTLLIALIIAIPCAIGFLKIQRIKIEKNIPKDMTLKIIESKIKDKEVQNDRRKREETRRKNSREREVGERESNPQRRTDIASGQEEVRGERRVSIPESNRSGENSQSTELHKPAALRPEQNQSESK